jgi:energy-coupling factor transporter ATP-binding protein EcfA2
MVVTHTGCWGTRLARLSKLNEFVAEVTGRLKSYRIQEGSLWYSFVDRELEVTRILDPRVGVVAGGLITVLYGPKGCGKTSLFKVLRYALEGVESDVDIVIVSSEVEAWRAEKLYAPRTLSDVLREVEGILGFSVTPTGDIVGSMSVYASKLIGLMVGYIARILKGKRRVIIVLDEVRADSDDRLAEFRGWLEGFANTLKWDNQEYSEKSGGSISVVALTSDALVSEIRYKVGSKVNWALIWNLPYNAMVELSKQLELDLEPQLLWRLTGGNPRALVSIRSRGLELWLRADVVDVLARVVESLRGEWGGDVWGRIAEAVSNVDEANFRLKIALLKHNVLIYTGGVHAYLSDIPKEEWVGRYYAYQIPAYYHVLKLMSERRSVEVRLEDVLGYL